MQSGFRVLRSVILVLGLFFAPLATPFSTAQNLPQADAHLTIQINADGSNQLKLEIAAHPLVDPLVRKGLSWLRDKLPEGPGNPRVALRDSRRQGRVYASLEAKLDSLGDLNALIRTPQLTSQLLEAFGVKAEIPALFTQFEAAHDVDDRTSDYTLRATMAPETTQGLSFMDLSVHVLFPYAPTETNAKDVKGSEMTWKAVPGESLEITAVATPSGIAVARTARWLLPLLGGVAAAAILVLIIFLLLSRRRAGSTSRSDPYA